MTRVAAVDCGTNSTRLLVAEADGQGPLRPLERHMRITRLGQGVDATGRLDDAALDRTLDVLDGYARLWAQHRVTKVQISATSAVRDAADRERFFSAAHERCGVRPVLLSGEEEARASFLGATTGCSARGPYLVLDIGGGSTEFIIGQETAEQSTSRQIGCVRLTERCLPDDPPAQVQYERALAVVDEELDVVAGLFDASAAATLIGVAGTVTTLAGLHLGLEAYDPGRIHRTRVPLGALRQLLEDLAWVPSSARAQHGVIAPGREDVIVAGALVLVRVMERFGFAEVVASEADILDGVALQLVGAPTRDVRSR